MRAPSAGTSYNQSAKTKPSRGRRIFAGPGRIVPAIFPVIVIITDYASEPSDLFDCSLLPLGPARRQCEPHRQGQDHDHQDANRHPETPLPWLLVWHLSPLQWQVSRLIDPSQLTASSRARLSAPTIGRSGFAAGGGSGLGGPFAANRFVQAAFLIGLAMRKALSIIHRLRPKEFIVAPAGRARRRARADARPTRISASELHDRR
jgi:hypothetical protein